MKIKYLIEKEFKRMIRDSFMPKLILIFPCMMMILMPWAADLEIKNINLGIVDNDHSDYSRRLIHKINASEYFHLKEISPTYNEAMQSIEKGSIDIILEIPPFFEKDLIKEKNANVLISANTVNGTKGGLGSSYMMEIINSFAGEIQQEWLNSSNAGNLSANVNISVQNRFNPHLNYKFFMVPALMVMLLTMLCGFLPALNIVSEKEIGTIEQINVTPVSKFTFILAKLIPYWIVGFIVLNICFLLAKVLYGISPVGSLFTLYFFSLIFIVLISGFGLIISNYSGTMQQAMFVMFFFMIILILLSGLFTPVASMPEWAQTIVIFNPLKYFIQVMRAVYLRGSGIAELIPQLTALLSFAVTLNIWAVLSYRKNS